MSRPAPLTGANESRNTRTDCDTRAAAVVLLVGLTAARVTINKDAVSRGHASRTTLAADSSGQPFTNAINRPVMARAKATSGLARSDGRNGRLELSRAVEVFMSANISRRQKK